ncbi:MAG TPA: carboxypeptidase-like regulatory domain-containing protein [Candidatus Acidoferrum sp.]|nr:carboxypeptidase-like regulatory domain-containing protein [Candidatus Acidoferrum sp.]
MLKVMTHKPIAVLLTAGLVYLGAGQVQAATPIHLSGAISGFVFDSNGVAQMGAAVTLFNKQDRQFLKVFTDERGSFQFLSLLPDVYTVKVTMASFVPAVRKSILVQPGMRSVLSVNMNTLFSSIQFSYPPIDGGTLMSDEWKWVLRSATPTRPVLRFTPDALAKDTKGHTGSRGAVFSDTRGVVKLSAGDASAAPGTGSEADLGTAFALATSLYGNNILQVSGNLGYGSQTGVPSAAIRTSYSRSMGGGTPEFSVTMRQLFLPGRMSSALAGQDAGASMLRSMSASFDDRTEIAEGLTVQYGFTMNSVSFTDRLTYASPYARLAYSTGDGGEFEVAYTAGDARPDLAGRSKQDAEFQQDLSTLALFPRISVRQGRARVQRGTNIEASYSRKMGSRTYQITAFRESISNAALSVIAPSGLYSGDDILPDLFTGTSTFNAGDFHSTGYTASVTQNLGSNVSATLMYGSMGGLTAKPREIVSNSPDELRAMIHAGRKNAATVRVVATAPWTGTHMIASYQWNGDRNWAMPGHLYSIQAVRPMPGLNLMVRQPIPGLGVLPWRMELTADLRNLLAQGYLPLGSLGGQQVLLVETPRGFRGGLSFIF